ncbi:MAG: hypothetical protein HRU09_03895 [Oligoflexales bacterium]|nr:hypothetical protein [Oligoflexales bacterium]
MIQDLIKWLVKIFLHLVVWVFILSIQWEGRTLYDRAHEILVDNPLVDLVDEELKDLWDKVSATAASTYAKLKSEENKEKIQ